MSAPLVSCLMPTADRRSFIPAAIKNFQSQQGLDYLGVELIVYDSGVDPISELIPTDDKRIAYVRGYEGRGNHGSLLNQCINRATGKYCIVTDDDDLFDPYRVSEQIKPFIGNDDVLLTGTSTLYYIRLVDAWIYSWPGPSAPWLASIAFRRSYAIEHRFKPVSSGADFIFTERIAMKNRVDLRDASLIVAAVHDDNAEPKLLHGKQFTKVDWDKLPTWYLESL
jgi:glycosyltransferase involved in cell wall biosynthesis